MRSQSFSQTCPKTTTSPCSYPSGKCWDTFLCHRWCGSLRSLTRGSAHPRDGVRKASLWQWCWSSKGSLLVKEGIAYAETSELVQTRRFWWHGKHIGWTVCREWLGWEKRQEQWAELGKGYWVLGFEIFIRRTDWSRDGLDGTWSILCFENTITAAPV